MACINSVDFSTGDFSQCASQTNAGITSLVVPFGRFAAVLNRLHNVGNIEIRQSGQHYYSVGTVYYRWYFLYSEKAHGPGAHSAICGFQDRASNGKAFLHLDSDGHLLFFDAAGKPLATGRTKLLPGVVTMLGAKIGTGTRAPWEIRIDDKLELSGTGNLGTENNGSLKLGGNMPYTDTFYYDEIAIDDATYPAAVTATEQACRL
jgi:hypothetical protein